MLLHNAPHPSHQHADSLHTTSIADLPVQLIATGIGRCLSAIELLRCLRVSQRFYRAFALKPLAMHSTPPSNDVDTTAARDTWAHLAWVGSTLRPTNVQFRRCCNQINWRSLQLLEHLDLSLALQHLPGTAADVLLHEILPQCCQQLRTLIVHTGRRSSTSVNNQYTDATPLRTFQVDLQHRRHCH